MKRVALLLLALVFLWGCEPEPIPIVDCPCDCAGPDLDCADFATREKGLELSAHWNWCPREVKSWL